MVRAKRIFLFFAIACAMISVQAQQQQGKKETQRIPMCIEDVCLGQIIGFLPAERAIRTDALSVGPEGFKKLQEHGPYCRDVDENVTLSLPSGRRAAVVYEAAPFPGKGQQMLVKSIKVQTAGNFTTEQQESVLKDLAARFGLKLDSENHSRNARFLGEMKATGSTMNRDVYLKVSRFDGLEVHLYFQNRSWQDLLAAQPSCSSKTPKF